MKIVVIDGQGGNIGKRVVEEIKANGIQSEVMAIGTNDEGRRRYRSYRRESCSSCL